MKPSKRPGREPPRPLPKRFYKAVTVVAAVCPFPRGEGMGKHGGRASSSFRILLDGKPMRTPAKAEFALPTKALAEAVAAEWEAQRERIDPGTMPLTKLANSAIDGVTGREAEVRAEIVKYAGSDLLCYRAEGPQALIERQAEAWDPVFAWAADALGARLRIASGIMPVAQPDATVALEGALEPHGAFALAALHVMTTLMGSALLALAHAHGRLSAEAAWGLAHVDEDWQINQWGEDAEASARRAQRWAEMQAAGRLLAMLG